jgi:glycosyltransferase involved in cell wall biosynthesis
VKKLKVTEKKKILLVSNGFYPEISPRSYRATELAKEFYRQGHDVTVISKFRDHNYSDFLSGYPITFKMWGKSRFPKVPQYKHKPFSFFSRVISRVMLILFEYPGIEDMFKLKKMLKYENGYELMISFAVPYPVHWGVAWARTRKNLIAEKWVADCGDPYMGDVLDSFRKLFYFGFLEKWFCRKADYISIPISGAINGYYSEFHHKIKVIPQGFDFDLNKKTMELPSNDCPTFAYAGGFLPGARDPQPFMNFLKSLDMPFRFLVYTNKPDILNEYKESMNLKLLVSPYIPRSELMEVMAGMDFLVNFDNHTNLNSPSKLIDYAITRRPVLNISNNFDGEDLLSFLKGDYRCQMKLPNPGQNHIKTITRHFLDLL